MCISFANPTDPCCGRGRPRRCPICRGINWAENTYLYEQPAAERGIVVPFFTAPAWYREQYQATDGTPIARFAAVSFRMEYLGSCVWSNGPVRSLIPNDSVPAIGGTDDNLPHLGDVRPRVHWSRTGWLHPFNFDGGTSAANMPADFYTLQSGQWDCDGVNLWIRNDAASPWIYPDIYPAWIRISFVPGQGTFDPRQNTNQVIA